jgi:hypothetical protein
MQERYQVGTESVKSAAYLDRAGLIQRGEDVWNSGQDMKVVRKSNRVLVIRTLPG